MKVSKTKIEGLLIIEPLVYEDERGYFFESYNRNDFKIVGIDDVFVQDNQSMSAANVLRGLHFQEPPHTQGKLVRVIRGAVCDIAVDIRRQSPTYGQYHKILLSAENKTIFWIPRGFAHGFLTLEEDTVFSYKCTAFYNKEAEKTILWNDPDLNIEWGTTHPITSAKDEKALLFRDYVSLF